MLGDKSDRKCLVTASPCLLALKSQPEGHSHGDEDVVDLVDDSVCNTNISSGYFGVVDGHSSS